MLLEARDLGKTYPNGYAALAGVGLDIAAGEIVAVVGASGCGKSTLLRLVAGLERPSRGVVRVAGREVTGPSRALGLVFQEPRLMPWLTVRDNVAFGLGHLPRAERRELAEAAVRRVHLAGFAGALPKQLSGGMAQRTALARALVTRPPVLLLDEPFSALDALTRQALQDELLALWAEDRPTMLLVTHDLDEALALADRVLVLGGSPGRVRRELAVDLPRPRRRTAPEFQRLKEELLGELPVVLPAAA
jgi:sulfonate transport system ATP-binding protein